MIPSCLLPPRPAFGSLSRGFGQDGVGVVIAASHLSFISFFLSLRVLTFDRHKA